MSENLVKISRFIFSEEVVEGCFLDYYYVEVIYAGVQCLLVVSVYFLLQIYNRLFGDINNSEDFMNSLYDGQLF